MRKRRASSTESDGGHSQVSDYFSDASVASNKKRKTQQTESPVYATFPTFSNLSLQPEQQTREVEMQPKPDHVVYVNSLSDSEDEGRTEQEKQEIKLRNTMARRLVQMEQERLAADWRNPQWGAMVLYQPVVKPEGEKSNQEQRKDEAKEQDEPSGMDLDD